MIENEENEFCSFIEENNFESEIDNGNQNEDEKIIICEDDEEITCSNTAIDHIQNEFNEATEKESLLETKSEFEMKSPQANLCDIILENLNRRNNNKPTRQTVINSISQYPTEVHSDFISTNGKVL